MSYFRDRAILLVVCFCMGSLQSLASSNRKPASKVASSPELEKKVNQIEESVSRVEAEVEVVRAQTRLLIQQSRLGVLDRFYWKGGISVVSPRPRTFDFVTQTGLGPFLGVGHYFGRHHVIDLSLEWDIYPAVSLQYRFEFHSVVPVLSWGPVLGIKTRAAEVGPLDNFLESPDQLKSVYYQFGIMLGFPMETGMICLQFLYWGNQHSFLTTTGGIHIFF